MKRNRFIAKTLSVILAISCIIGCSVSAFATNIPVSEKYCEAYSSNDLTEIDYSSYIDANGHIKAGCGGYYFYCTKTDKFFATTCSACPYCGSEIKTVHYYSDDGIDIQCDSFYKVSENDDLVCITYTIACPNGDWEYDHVNTVTGRLQPFNRPEIGRSYEAYTKEDVLTGCPWTEPYAPAWDHGSAGYIYQTCKKCNTKLTENDIKREVIWESGEPTQILKDDTHETLIASHTADDTARATAKHNLLSYCGVDDNGNSNTNTSIWQKIAAWFTNLISTIVTFFGNLF